MPASLARVLLVDDDAQFFEEVKSRLRTERDIIIGWSRTRALEDVPDDEYAHADVVMTDSDKHGPELADTVSRVKSRFHHLQFLILGSAEDDTVTMILLESGARGYLDLQTSGENLASAIRRLASGGTWVPPHILARYMDLIQMVEFLPKTGAENDPWAQFTAREQRVLTLMACGRSNKEIGRVIGVDETIVSSTIHQLMHRTGAVNRPSLIAYYLYHKLFRGESLPAMDAEKVLEN
ncbi:MAG TPA: response regulator transcription factor [Bryobacterales bacterium]|nr:response regulator transcription factor [Bryobacterales bacterium]